MPSEEQAPLLTRSGAVGAVPAGQGGRGFLYVLTILSAIGGFLFGYDTGVVGGAMLIVAKDFENFTDAQHSLAVSITMVGCMLAVAVSGPATERLGRQPVILGGSCIFALGAGAMAAAPNVLWLVIGRFIVGVAVGLASMAIPMYIAEVAPSDARGALVTVNNVFITGGQFIACVVDALLSHVDYPHGWRWMLGLGAVPAVIQFVGFLCLPESPRWLASHRSEAEARAVLQRIRATDNVGAEMAAITKAISAEEERKAAGGTTGFVAGLQSPPLRRAMTVGVMLQLIQQLSGSSAVSLALLRLL